jgi:hypothetical protein
MHGEFLNLPLDALNEEFEFENVEDLKTNG